MAPAHEPARAKQDRATLVIVYGLLLIFGPPQRSGSHQKSVFLSRNAVRRARETFHNLDPGRACA
jgi:hypothetical protein